MTYYVKCWKNLSLSIWTTFRFFHRCSANIGLMFDRSYKRFWMLNFFFKAEKCLFHAKTVTFLGFIVSEGMVHMHPDKVVAVLKWPVPQSVKEVQRFLGFAYFYRRFIQNFGAIAAPIIALTKKERSSRFSWSSEADKAFGELKKRFISTCSCESRPVPPFCGGG